MSTNLWSGRWRGRVPAGDQHHRAREVISPSGGIMRGKFPSRKNGRMVHHEGLLELDALYLLEAASQVTCYREQPITFHYPDDGRTRRYTPDLEVTLVSGQTVWIEVKPKVFLQKQDVLHKLAMVAEHLKSQNQPFVVLTDEVLRFEPRQSNLRMIYHRASRNRPSHMRAQSVLAQCADRFPAPLAQIREILAPHGLEPYSLLLVGLLRCPLDKPLTATTLISTTREIDHGWFQLAQEHGF